MPEVGIKELKTHTSEIVREVREQRVSYVITHRGKPAGLLIPFEQSPEASLPKRSDDAIWEELWRIGEEISRGWEPELTSEQILDEMRR